MLVWKVVKPKANMSTCPSDTDNEATSPHIQVTYSFVRGKYACKLQDMLYQQTLQNSSFCDVTLHIDNSVMKAHWAVLVVCPYFQSLYDSGMKESMSGELNLNFGAPYAMKDAIKFLYTGEVHVTMERVRDLLEVGDYLQISEMTDICVKYLKTINLTLENCVQILLLSSQHNLETYDSALKFVNGHLPELMSGAELLNFDKASLLSLVSDNTLSYVKREDFFRFIVRWTEENRDQRKNDFEELFCALDLHSIPSSIFEEKIEQHALVQESQKCQLLCLERKVKGIVRTAPCSPNMTDVIVVGGGMNKDHRYRYMFYPKNINSSLYAYFLREQRWAKMPDLPFGISKPLLTLTGEGQLLVIDSMVQDDSDKHKQLLCYCPQEDTWTTSKMNFPEDEYDFSVHAFLACGGRLFLVASSKRRLPVPHVPPPKGQKSPTVAAAAAAAAPAPDTLPAPILYHVQLLELQRDTGNLTIRCGFFQRFSTSEVHAACQQAHNSATLDGNVIYVMGNKVAGLKSKPSNKRKSNKFFTFDLHTNRAREVYGGSKMGYEPLAFGLTDGFFTTRLGKVNHKFYDQGHKKMTYSRNLTVKLPPKDPGREDFASAAVNDEVYIFGGRAADTQEPTTSAAKFSFATQQWTELDPVPSALIGAGITRGRMAVGVLLCHLQCPHCAFRPLKDRTMYDVPFGSRDRDDGGSGRFYDMEDSDGSDDYDYYDYDDYEPSYSDDGWGPYLDPDEYDLYDLF